MKLNNNHKIILGLAIGGGIAWWLTRKKSATTSNSTAITNAEAEDLTREEKIDFILDSTEPTDKEISTGISGERFEYDPKLGYSLPSGVVRLTSAGGEMTLPREGNLAQEVFFNADGEATSDPVEEAQAILDGLTDEELNIAFKVARVKRNRPNISDEDALKIAKIKQGKKQLFRGIVKDRINDIKALSKSPNWKKGLIRKLKDRKAMQGMNKDQRIAYRQELKAKRQEIRAKRKGRKEARMDRREAREEMQNEFSQQMTNREGGAMWGGYRNDGRPNTARERKLLKRYGSSMKLKNS